MAFGIPVAQKNPFRGVFCALALVVLPGQAVMRAGGRILCGRFKESVFAAKVAVTLVVEFGLVTLDVFIFFIPGGLIRFRRGHAAAASAATAGRPRTDKALRLMEGHVGPAGIPLPALGGVATGGVHTDAGSGRPKILLPELEPARVARALLERDDTGHRDGLQGAKQTQYHQYDAYKHETTFSLLSALMFCHDCVPCPVNASWGC